jgi:hypothetical protein
VRIVEKIAARLFIVGLPNDESILCTLLVACRWLVRALQTQQWRSPSRATLFWQAGITIQKKAGGFIEQCARKFRIALNASHNRFSKIAGEPPV